MNILVTGANRGIGLKLVQKGIEKGHFMIATVRSKHSKLSELRRLKHDYPHLIEIIELDVTCDFSVRQAREKMEKEKVELNAIFHCANLLFKDSEQLSSVNPRDALTSFEVNAVGPLRITQAFFPFLQKESRSFVTFSAVNPNRFISDRSDYLYVMSKAALQTMTQKLKLEYPDVHVKAYYLDEDERSESEVTMSLFEWLEEKKSA